MEHHDLLAGDHSSRQRVRGLEVLRQGPLWRETSPFELSGGEFYFGTLGEFYTGVDNVISQRTKDKIAEAKRKGRWCGGLPPLGYAIHPDGGKLEVEEAEAEMVRAIFQLYQDRRSLLAVAEELNRRGWVTKSWRTKSGRTWGGKPWTKTLVHNLISNAVYLGKVRHRGEVFEGEHDAIIPKRTFGKVQSLLAENRQHGGARVRNRYGHLLRGLLRCSACDAAMSPSVSVKGNRRYRYYVCSSAQKKGWKTCPKPSLNAQQLENLVVDRIRRIGQDPGLQQETVRQVKKAQQAQRPPLVAEQKRLRRQVKKTSGEIRRLLDALAKGEVQGAAITDRRRDLEERVATHQKRLAEVKNELAALDQATVNATEVAKALSLFNPIWTLLFPMEQERVIRLLIQRIDYDGKSGKLAIQFAPTGIKTLAGEIEEAREATA